MDILDTSLPKLSKLVEQRLALVRRLAESLESSRLALVQNDAEAIARGAAHQAELCRQWSHLEDELRRRTSRSLALPQNTLSEKMTGSDSALEHSARLQAEWEALGTRIRYLTRVHCSLLRHLQRSFAIVNRVVDSCAPTYRPDPRVLENNLGRGIPAPIESALQNSAGE
jgi:FlgN protein